MEISSDKEKGHVAIFAFPFTGKLPSPPLFDLTYKLATAIPNTIFSFFGSKSTRYDLPSNLKTYSTWENHFPAESYKEKASFHDALRGEAEIFLKKLPCIFKMSVESAVVETKREITCFLADAPFAFEVDKLAQVMNLPWVAFSDVAPHTLSTFFHLDLIRRTYLYHSSDNDNLKIIPGLSNFRIGDLSTCDVAIKEEEDKVSFDAATWLSRNLSSLSCASAVTFCCYEELYPTVLNSELKSKLKCLLYLGAFTLPLPPQPLPPPSVEDVSGCLSWLDKQNQRSVAYISFGTEGNPPPEEIVALAQALEASAIPFMWSIRDIREKEHFPQGFLERTSNGSDGTQGKVVLWAPQGKVLTHSSIGVFVTHCGYYSVMESVVGEVPLIIRPKWTDNYLTARLVEDVWGIGVRVKGGKFSKNGMLKCFELVFDDYQGNKLVENVKALKEVIMKAAGPCGSAASGFKNLADIITKGLKY